MVDRLGMRAQFHSGHPEGKRPLRRLRSRRWV